MFRIKNYKGVTFVEIMVVIAIISIFAVISYKSMVNNRHWAEVEAAASEIASLINQNRSFALTGKQVNTGFGFLIPDCFAMRLYCDNGSNHFDFFQNIAAFDFPTDTEQLCNHFNGSLGIKHIIYDTKLKISGSFCDTYIKHRAPNGYTLFSSNHTIMERELRVESDADSNIFKKVKINKYRAWVE